MRLEELGHLEGVGAVALHAQVERFEALNEQERVEGRDGRAHVAQELQALLGSLNLLNFAQKIMYQLIS
jgi:hypothetical protein